MRKILLVLACLLTIQIEAFEYQLQFENEQVSIARAEILPHEEIGFHRDAYPQIVIALQGGIVTRVEADGRIVDVEFPTNIAVFRPTDPENQLHRSVNNSDVSIELIIIQLKNSANKPE